MDLLEKLENSERLSFEEGLKLYELDIFTLGLYANKQRFKRFGHEAYFNLNRHINPTNICADVCKFCAFSANRKNPNPYIMTHEQILSEVEKSVQQGALEIHIVSAHHPDAGLEWYMDIFKKIKQSYPSLHVKALTAAEVDYLSRIYGKSYAELIDMMVEYGVDSMPGGGAEIFDEEVRSYICKGKVNSAQWLEIHKLWHQRGKMSNATMLFGHVEKKEHRIDHMLRLRELQDETNGFNAFIPLVYQTQNNFLNVKHQIGSEEILKTMAISRLMLDNIPHIKAYWATSTINLALVALEFGADDLDGTIQKELIQSAAGASSANGLHVNDFVSLIHSAGFTPVQRDSLYNTIKVY